MVKTEGDIKAQITNDSVDLSKERKSYTFIISIVLGVIGIIFAWIFVLIGHIASIVRIIFAIKELHKNKLAYIGLGVSIIGELFSIFFFIFCVTIVLSFMLQL